MDDTDTNNADIIESGLIQLARKYTELFPLRAAIQAIPLIGGSIDTIFSGLGSSWQNRRLEILIQTLSEDMNFIKTKHNINVIEDIESSEEFFDFILIVFDRVIKTRNVEKLKRFSNIVSRQILELKKWDDAESALRLLNEFTENHIKILLNIMEAPICGNPFEGLRVIALDSNFNNIDRPPMVLDQYFPSVDKLALKLSCSDLLSRGLIYDEGEERIGVKPKVYFSITDLGKWFINWVKEINEIE